MWPGFLTKLFSRDPDSGLFGFLKNWDNNRTQRAIEKDRNQTQLELERERRRTALGVIDHLASGGEYLENANLGIREVRRPTPPPTAYVLPPQDDSSAPPPAELIGLVPRQAWPLGLPQADEQPPDDDEEPLATRE
jgi:hypothetical protein